MKYHTAHALESSITSYLEDVERSISLFEQTYQKWEIINEKQQTLTQRFDTYSSLSVSYSLALKTLQELPTYKLAYDEFTKDPLLGDAERRAGHWGTFDTILAHLVAWSSAVHSGAINISPKDAISELRRIREFLTYTSIEYTATARFLGVHQTQKHIDVPQGVTLRRLTQRERNARQPKIGLFYTMDDHRIARHKVELQVKIKIPIDHDEDNVYFYAQNKARETASEIFRNIEYSVMLAVPGACTVGPIHLEGGLPGMPHPQPQAREPPLSSQSILRRADIYKIYAAHSIVSGKHHRDKALTRAVHRFLIGRQRTSPDDRIVDYVIAWEALLLTSAGTPLSQELAYRFAIHGSIAISRLHGSKDRLTLYRSFRSIYRARSAIVHGGTDGERDDELKKGGFKNVSGASSFLERNFQMFVVNIINHKLKERPYIADSGWEKLVLNV